ncbi:MAG: FtsX-like permease family protein [Romboutsia sp.]
MKLSKLINRNMKKTFSDYLIYFVTLCFCSSLFFSYLTLGSNNHPILSGNYIYSVEGFSKTAVALTYVISLIFLGLTHYVNNFMIKQRSKEFSVYMILGTPQEKIAKLFFIETYLIGICAVFIGCMLGTVFASFLSSFIVSYVSGESSYKFTIYMDVFLQTIIYFSIVFIIIGIFNTNKLNKMSLLQVINERKIIEIKRISKSKYILYLIFTVFCFSFPLMISNSQYYMNIIGELPDIYAVLPSFLPYLALYTGYYILSYSIKIFIDYNPKLKLKRLNTILFNNLFARILSNIRSIATITAIFVVATYSLILGPIVTEFAKGFFEYRLPYDLIISYQDTSYDKSDLLKDAFSENDIEVDEISLIKEYSLSEIDSLICGITDYNKARTMNNLNPISLEEDEFIYHISNKTNKDEFIKNLYVENENINIGNKVTLNLPSNKSKSVYNDAIGEWLSYNTVVVPDEVLEFLKLDYYGYYVNTKQSVPLEKSTDVMSSITTNLDILNEEDIELHTLEENQYIAISAGMYAFFIGVGIIFFIIALTILTLQQLSDAKINKEKYGILHKIGVDRSNINKLINKQVFILFMIPYVFGVLCSSHFVSTFYSQWEGYIYAYMGFDKFILSVLFGFSVILVIFAIYYISSICMYKNIIKDEF